jgi:DNA-binding NarL/FixJ family response regulator
MRIIIVDDFVLFREGIVALLGTEKDIQIVGLAGSVREAIAMAGEMEPEIVLMDNDLPDGNGAEATRSILARQPNCKVIFLTTCEEDQSLFEAIRCGAKGYLSKTISPQKLLASIRAVYRGEAAISRLMTLHLMNELARTKEDVLPTTNIHKILTSREQEVLRMLASGMNNHDISVRLFLSQNTVKHYVYTIFEKLKLTNRREAVSIAHQCGLVD